MINIKVTMVNGKEYNVVNWLAENVKDFIKFVFMPQGVTMMFVEILPNEYLYTGNVLNIRELTDEEIRLLNGPAQMPDDEKPTDEQDNEELPAEE